MSQESIPELPDSESPALPVEQTSLSDSEKVVESTPIANQDRASEKVAERSNTPSSPRPKSASRVASGGAVTANQATSWQRFQHYWQVEIQPALKEQTIKTLKATIRSLESLVSRLEAKPVASSPKGGKAPWRQIQEIWGAVLGLTRSLLPRSLRRLSDVPLSGAIAAVFLLTLWTTSSFVFSKSPTQIATAPDNQAAPVKPPDSPENRVPNDPPVVKLPPDIAPDPRPKQPLLTPPEKAPDVTSAETTKPIPSPIITPTPAPPPLKLTPEQTLIARIQDQVAEVSNHYVNGLIQSVQANFRSSLLTVKVGDDWYTLEQAQQNKLANEMLKRAQQLNFVKLELTDSESSLLARSPVVGSEMVILKRTTSQKTV